MGRLNYNRLCWHTRITRRGFESVRGATDPATAQALYRRSTPEHRPSKAELRREAAAAFLAWRARKPV